MLSLINNNQDNNIWILIFWVITNKHSSLVFSYRSLSQLITYVNDLSLISIRSRGRYVIISIKNIKTTTAGRREEGRRKRRRRKNREIQKFQNVRSKIFSLFPSSSWNPGHGQRIEPLNCESAFTSPPAERNYPWNGQFSDATRAKSLIQIRIR